MNTNAAEPSASPTPPRSGVLSDHPMAAVLLLMAINSLNYLDRMLPTILAEHLKTDLELSDTELGFLNGIGFTLVYALAGIPIARVADKGRYGFVISCALGFWSFMTALGSIVTTATMLALTRFGVAVGEAGNTPAAHAFISSKFRPADRAAPLAILTMGTAVGSMLGLVGGGLLAEALGWRGTFLVMGLAGLLLAPVSLWLLGKGEPRPDHKSAPLADLAKHVRNRTVAALFVGFGFMSIAAYTLSAFSPAFLIRVHGLSVGSAGVQLGLLNGFIGIVALLSAGWLASRLTRRAPNRGLIVLAVFMAATIPVSAGAFLIEHRTAATLLVGLTYAVMATYLALTVGPVHSLVPESMRAQASALLLFASAVVGGLGPLLTGAISDAFSPIYGPRALGYGMLIIPVCLTIAAICYTIAARTLARDMEAEARNGSQ